MRRVGMAVAVMGLVLLAGCDQFKKGFRQGEADSILKQVYGAVGEPLTPALTKQAMAKIDQIPEALPLEQRFRCTYEAMIIADLSRRRANKATFAAGHRFTDDDLSDKVDPDHIFLRDAPPTDGLVSEAFLRQHVAAYDVPADDEAVFNAAVWEASLVRLVTESKGVATADSNKWMRKNRSADPADVRYRATADLGVGDKACYDLIQAPLQPAAASANGPAMDKLVGRLVPR